MKVRSSVKKFATNANVSKEKAELLLFVKTLNTNNVKDNLFI